MILLQCSHCSLVEARQLQHTAGAMCGKSLVKAVATSADMVGGPKQVAGAVVWSQNWVGYGGNPSKGFDTRMDRHWHFSRQPY
jgi:hypothetical protein